MKLLPTIAFIAALSTTVFSGASQSSIKRCEGRRCLRRTPGLLYRSYHDLESTFSRTIDEGSSVSFPSSSDDKDAHINDDDAGTLWALMGDSGLNTNSKLLWRQLAQIGVDGVIHAGDLAYELGKASTFVRTVDQIFNPNVPYLATVGDHDVYEFDEYAARFNARNKQVSGLRCQGRWGVTEVCEHKNIVTFGLGIGFTEANYEEWLEENLRKFKQHPWKICFWHKVGNELNPGTKADGFDVTIYEICRRHGAIVLTGHEHLYGRSVTVSSSFHNAHVRPQASDHEADGQDEALEEQLLDAPTFSDQSNRNIVEVSPGKTFLIVSGLSGAQPREWSDKRAQSPLWAAVIAKQNHAAFGALVCNFPSKPPYEAFCFYRDTKGFVWDRFIIRSSPDTSVDSDAAELTSDDNPQDISNRYPAAKYQQGWKWNLICHSYHFFNRRMAESRIKDAYEKLLEEESALSEEKAEIAEEQAKTDAHERSTNSRRQRILLWASTQWENAWARLQAAWQRLRGMVRRQPETPGKRRESEAFYEQQAQASTPADDECPTSVFSNMYHANVVMARDVQSTDNPDVYIHEYYRVESHPITVRRFETGNQLQISFSANLDWKRVTSARLQLTGSTLPHNVEPVPETRMKRFTKNFNFLKNAVKDVKTLVRQGKENVPKKPIAHRITIEADTENDRTGTSSLRPALLQKIPWFLSRKLVNEAGDRGRWVSPSFHYIVRDCLPGQPCAIILTNEQDEEYVQEWMDNFLIPGLTVSAEDESVKLQHLQARLVVEYTFRRQRPTLPDEQKNTESRRNTE